MLTINHASLDAFIKHLREQEYSPATIAKYAHDVQTLLQYAPEGIRDKEHLNSFRAWLEPCWGRSTAFSPFLARTGGSNMSAYSAGPFYRQTGSLHGRNTKVWFPQP